MSSNSGQVVFREDGTFANARELRKAKILNVAAGSMGGHIRAFDQGRRSCAGGALPA